MDYKILGKIGEGGMGQVFLAVQESLDRKVALKTLNAGALDTEELLERFRREAKLLCTLSHPGIVPVFDSGVMAGRPYFAMELVEGESLAERLECDGSLTLPGTLSVVEQVADALAHLHERGIVHRDLKPRNLILAPGGPDGTDRVVLVDFGLAWIHTAQAITRAGNLVGTVAYLAPEIFRTQPTGAPQDVWALAVVACEMLRGAPLFRGAAVGAVVSEILEFDPESLSGRVPEAPAELRRLLARCLAPDPAARPTARDVRHAVAALRTTPGALAPGRPRTRGGSKPTRAPGPTTRRRAGATSAALGLAVLVLAWPGRRESPPPPSVPASGSLASPGPDAVSPDERRGILRSFHYCLRDRYLLVDFQNPKRREMEVSLGDRSHRTPEGAPACRAFFEGITPDAVHWLTLRTGAGETIVSRVPLHTAVTMPRDASIRTIAPWAALSGVPGSGRLGVDILQQVMDDALLREHFFDVYDLPQMLPCLSDWIEKGKMEEPHLDELREELVVWRDREVANRLLRRLPPVLDARSRYRIADVVHDLHLDEHSAMLEAWWRNEHEGTIAVKAIGLVALRPRPVRLPFVLEAMAMHPGSMGLREVDVAIACDREAARRFFKEWIETKGTLAPDLHYLGMVGLSRLGDPRADAVRERLLASGLEDGKGARAFRSLAAMRDPAARAWFTRSMRERWPLEGSSAEIVMWTAALEGIPIEPDPAPPAEPPARMEMLRETGMMLAGTPGAGVLETARERLTGPAGWTRDLAICRVARWSDAAAAPALERLMGSRQEDPDGLALWARGRIRGVPPPAGYVEMCLDEVARTEEAGEARAVCALVAAYLADRERVHDWLADPGSHRKRGPILSSLQHFLRDRKAVSSRGAVLHAFPALGGIQASGIDLAAGDSCLIRSWGFVLPPGKAPVLAYTSGLARGVHGLMVHVGSRSWAVPSSWFSILTDEPGELFLESLITEADQATSPDPGPHRGLVLLDVLRGGER